MNIKRFFCDHIYKDISQECLTPLSIFSSLHLGFNGLYERKYRIYAITKQCVKCNHKEIEKRNIDI